MTYTTGYPPSRAPVVVRALARWTLYAGVLSGSFFLTLWLTEPDPIPNDGLDSRTGAERLAVQRVMSYADLRDAARAAGLRPGRRMGGSIDVMNRINERDVEIAGWVADAAGDGSALQLVVFVGGAYSAMTQTGGERPDVTRALGLAGGAEKNVSFRVNFGCRPGQQPVIVGVGASRQYLPLAGSRCP